MCANITLDAKVKLPYTMDGFGTHISILNEPCSVGHYYHVHTLIYISYISNQFFYLNIT